MVSASRCAGADVIAAWLGPHGYDAPTLEMQVFTGQAMCSVLAATLALSLTEP